MGFCLFSVDFLCHAHFSTTDGQEHSSVICPSVWQGYLIANHLPKEALLDVCLYCQHYCLLPLASEQRVGQLVVWREVFPQRRTQTSTASLPAYCEPHGRHFLLIVGLVRDTVPLTFLVIKET